MQTAGSDTTEGRWCQQHIGAGCRHMICDMCCTGHNKAQVPSSQIALLFTVNSRCTGTYFTDFLY